MPVGTGAEVPAGVAGAVGVAVGVEDAVGDAVGASVGGGDGACGTVGSGVGFGAGVFVGGGVGLFVGFGVAGGGSGVGPARTRTVRVIDEWISQIALNRPGLLNRRSQVHAFCVTCPGHGLSPPCQGSSHLML